MHTTFRAKKYRVAPKNPATWHPYQELYQETREKKQSLSRAALSQLVASRWRHGARAQQPHGSNCIDIETYRIRPKVDVQLLGSQPIHTRLAHIFPTAVGVFGPLQFAIPNSPAMLFREYGEQCLQQRIFQDEGQSQILLEGSACKCSAGSLANHNIGKFQRVSEFMNRVLQVASSRWRRYAEILEATACKCLVPVEPVASSRWQRDAQRLEDGACRCGVQVASSRWQRDAWRLKGNACKCWMAVASRTWQRDAQM